MRETNQLRKWAKENRGNGPSRRKHPNPSKPQELVPDPFVPPTDDELIAKLNHP
jgi:hypothetical protein